MKPAANRPCKTHGRRLLTGRQRPSGYLVRLALLTESLTNESRAGEHEFTFVFMRLIGITLGRIDLSGYVLLALPIGEAADILQEKVIF